MWLDIHSTAFPPNFNTVHKYSTVPISYTIKTEIEILYYKIEPNRMLIMLYSSVQKRKASTER